MKKKKIYLFKIILLVSSVGILMSFYKQVLSSEIKGVVVDSAEKPLSNLKIIRKWDWAIANKRGSDETTSDEHGNFSFPEVTGFSILSLLLPHEPSISTEIIAFNNSSETILISFEKSNYKSNGEWIKSGDENKIGTRLVCRVGVPPGANGVYWGTCSFPE